METTIMGRRPHASDNMPIKGDTIATASKLTPTVNPAWAGVTARSCATTGSTDCIEYTFKKEKKPSTQIRALEVVSAGSARPCGFGYTFRYRIGSISQRELSRQPGHLNHRV